MKDFRVSIIDFVYLKIKTMRNEHNYQIRNQGNRFPSRSYIRHTIDIAVEGIVTWMSVTYKIYMNMLIENINSI